jgi:hypothetical protein
LSKAFAAQGLEALIMETWVVVFLGVMAVASLIQVGFLIALAIVARRTTRRAQGLGVRARRELRVPLAHLSEATRNVKEISTLVAAEARELRESAQLAAEEVRAAREDVRRAVRSPFVEIAALAKAFSTAVAAFRRPPAHVVAARSYSSSPEADTRWAQPRA